MRLFCLGFAMTNRSFNNGFVPPELIAGRSSDTARLKSEGVTISQQYIVNGWGWYFETDYPALAAGARTFLEFTIPANTFMALDYRQIITDKERVFYFVYPFGAYGTTTQIATRSVRNLRNDSAVTARSDVVSEVSVSPLPDMANAVIHIPIFGSVGSGNRASGDIETDSIFRLLAPGSKFLVEVYNASTTPCYINVSLVFGLLPSVGFQAPANF